MKPNPEILARLLQLAALLHVGILAAGVSMPRAVDLWRHLGGLPPFVRRLFLVYYGFIGLVIAGFGILTALFARAMAAGDPVARGLCILIAVFWTARLVVGGLVLDVTPYLRTPLHRIGYHALNLTFIYLVGVYGLVAIAGGAR